MVKTPLALEAIASLQMHLGQCFTNAVYLVEYSGSEWQ